MYQSEGIFINHSKQIAAQALFMQTLVPKLSGISVKDSENALRLYNIEAFAPVMDKKTLICSIETSHFF